MAEILLEKTGRVASVIIDRPPLNVLNLALLRELRRVLDELDRDGGVDLVEIRGAGERAFSAGVDVKDHTRAQVPEMLDLVHGVIRKLLSLRQPTVAVVDGVCLGGGCELASSCDLVLATEDSHSLRRRSPWAVSRRWRWRGSPHRSATTGPRK